ncbi:MAG: hypothetical protein WA786_04550 [Acidimicrobiales bacterium]
MDHSTFQWLAVVGATLIGGMMLLQILLAAGLPLGHAAFGGEHRVLPIRLRVASAVSVLVFAAAFCVILARVGLFGMGSRKSLLVQVGTWVLVVLFGLSTLANVASRSHWERRVMAPVALLLTICFVAVALRP